jgi:hypothetical protein
LFESGFEFVVGFFLGLQLLFEIVEVAVEGFCLELQILIFFEHKRVLVPFLPQ